MLTLGSRQEVVSLQRSTDKRERQVGSISRRHFFSLLSLIKYSHSTNDPFNDFRSLRIFNFAILVCDQANLLICHSFKIRININPSVAVAEKSRSPP